MQETSRNREAQLPHHTLADILIIGKESLQGETLSCVISHFAFRLQKRGIWKSVSNH